MIYFNAGCLDRTLILASVWFDLAWFSSVGLRFALVLGPAWFGRAVLVQLTNLNVNPENLVNPL